MHITELDLSPSARLCLEVADIYEVDRLLEHGTGRLIQRPEFSKGAELYEIVRELHRRGLTFSRPGGHIHGERELEMFRLRTVVGLSLDEIAQRSISLAGASISSCACTSGWTQYHPQRKPTGHGRLASVRTPSRIATGCTSWRAWRYSATTADPSRSRRLRGRLPVRPGNSSGHTLSSATAHSMKTSRPDGWTLPPNCSHSPRSRCAMWQAGSATVTRRTSPALSSTATGCHPQRFVPSRAVPYLTTARKVS
jgi:hypothetical protein